MNRNRATSLVSLLISVLIIGMLAVLFLFGSNMLFDRSDGEGDEPRSIPGKAIRAGETTAEEENLRQIRMSLQIAQDPVSGEYPATLDELNLPESTLTSPVNGKRFAYDPATGEVRRDED